MTNVSRKERRKKKEGVNIRQQRRTSYIIALYLYTQYMRGIRGDW